MRQFEIGKSYALHLPAKDGHGKTTFLTDIYTVTRRTPCYLTFSHISSDGTKMPHCRCKIFTSDMRGEFVHATAFFCLYADSYIDDDSQPEIPATADDAISASDNDSAMASQHAAVAIAQSETATKIDVTEWVKRNEEAKIIRLQNARKNADRDPDEGLSYEECVKLVNDVIYTNTPRYKDLCAANAVWQILYDCKPNDRGELARYITPNIYWADDPFIDKNTVRKSIDEVRREVEHMIDVMNSGRDISAHHGVYAVWQDNFNRHYKKGKYAQPEISQPENLYDDDSFSDASGDNSSPEQDIPECRENDAIPADNPGFTVIPSREIKRPDYASYQETIHDDIPCVNVPACDIQTYNHAAVVHERNTSTAEGFGIVLLKHRQLGFTFNTDCNPRQIWFDFEF